MNKTEMLEILRGKVLHESQEEIQSRLNEIADELEQSEKVVHGHWIVRCTPIGSEYTICSNCNTDFKFKTDRGTLARLDMRGITYCPNCGAKMDEHFADVGKKVDEVSE